MHWSRKCANLFYVFSMIFFVIGILIFFASKSNISDYISTTDCTTLCGSYYSWKNGDDKCCNDVVTINCAYRSDCYDRPNNETKGKYQNGVTWGSILFVAGLIYMIIWNVDRCKRVHKAAGEGDYDKVGTSLI